MQGTKYPLVRIFDTSAGSFIYDGISSRIICLKQDRKSEDIGEGFLHYLHEKDLINKGCFESVEWPVSYEQYLGKQEHCLERLVLQLTRRCNMRCEYCVYSGEFTHMKAHATQDMSEECMIRSMEFFLRHTRKEVEKEIFFYGGESLLCLEKIKNAIAYVGKEQNIHFIISSNGLLVKNDFAEWLSHNSNVEVHITLNGPFHDKYRKNLNGEGTLEEILQNIYYIKSQYPTVWNEQIKFITNIMSENEFEAMELFFQRLGKNPHVITGISSHMGNDKIKTLVSNERETKEEHNSLMKSYADNMSEFLLPYYGIEMTRINCRTIYKHKKGWISSCFPADSTLFVGVDGTFNMCEKVTDKISLGDIENGINRQVIRHLYEKMEALTNDKCKTCWIQRLCPVCFQNLFDKFGEMLDSMSEEWCEKQRRSIEENLKLYYEISQKYPDRLETFIYQDYFLANQILQRRKKHMVVSIDIGTTYSSMSMMGPDEKAVPVAIGEDGTGWGSKYSLPTAVFIEESGKVLVGQAAMRSRMGNPSRFCMEFKRNLGEVEPKLLGDRKFQIEELYSEVMLHMKRSLQKMTDDQIEKVYLTYPATYGKDKKERLLAAAKAAGFFQVELVDEPGAAAMSYCADGYIKEGQTVLVYDFGGGTFDAALIKYENETFQLLGEPGGLPRCGGMDMDKLIAKDMLDVVGKETVDGIRKNASNYKLFMSQLSEKAIRIKHQLSSAEAAMEYIPIGGWEQLNYSLSRDKFEQMIAPMVRDTIQLCNSLLEEANVKKNDLSAVILVGGTSRVPLVRQMLEAFAKSVPVYSAPDLELAVVQGALNYKQFVVEKSPEEYYQKAKKLDEVGDKQEAVKWFQKAAEQGYGMAQYELAKHYYNGCGIERSVGAAERWCMKATDDENVGDMMKIIINIFHLQLLTEYEKKSREFEEADDWCGAVKWFRKEAEQGGSTAQYRLGEYYKKGKGVEKDYKEAVKWFEKAAEQGGLRAQIALGVCYYDGEGVEKDYKKAVKWFQKAAEQGSGMAQYNLGLCYANGKGVEQNYTEAVKWYRKAAEQGNADAQCNLGWCYANGKGVTQSHTEAVEWYRKAAEQGNARAQYNLGVRYESGQGVTQSYTEAVEWYRKAAEQGYANAQNNLGVCYENGTGVTKAFWLAVEWYRKAAEQGNAYAQHNLGRCYEEGIGVVKHYSMAEKYYRKAAEQGDADAQRKLDRLTSRRRFFPFLS